jgi:hypothetical protein
MSFLFSDSKPVAMAIVAAAATTPGERKTSVGLDSVSLKSCHLKRGVTTVRVIKDWAQVKSFNASITGRHSLRFVATAGVSSDLVTVPKLLAAMGGICTITNSQLVSWASSIRVRRVTIFESAQGVATVSSEVLWANATDVNSKDETISASTVPYDRPSMLSSQPPKSSLASFWWNSSATTPLFALTCSIGSVIQVDVEFTLSNALTGATAAIATGSQGSPYFMYLDGPSTHVLLPVGVPTTF